MMELIVWMSYILGYASVAWAFGAVVSKMVCLDDDNPGPFFAGVFWPVALPVLAPVLVYKGVKSVRSPSLRRNNQAKLQEIASSPVSILSQLIVQKIQKEPERLSSDWHKRIYSYSWTSSDGKAAIEARDSESSLKIISVKSVKVDGKEVETETKPILAALNEAREFNKQKRLAEQERQRQLTALDAVETLLLSPVVEKEK